LSTRVEGGDVGGRGGRKTKKTTTTSQQVTGMAVCVKGR